MEVCVRTVGLNERTVVYLRSKSGFWADILNDLYMNVYFLAIFHIWVCTSLFHICAQMFKDALFCGYTVTFPIFCGCLRDKTVYYR